MTTLQPQTDSEQQQYRIGAVARLTGIPGTTLRIWERRYQVVTPHRSQGGIRLYDRTDIARLALLKRLVDSGDAIGTVARLSLDQLQERLALQMNYSGPVNISQTGMRVALLGDALTAQLVHDYRQRGTGFEIVTACRDAVDFENQIQSSQPDILIVEYPTIDEQTRPQVQHWLDTSSARQALVIYGFGRRVMIQQLDTTRITPLRAPVGVHELQRLCRSAPEGNSGGGVTVPLPVAATGEPRFDSDALNQIAQAASSVKCECPRHLVDLIRAMLSFENYSDSCEKRNINDALLHSRLKALAGQARSLIEQGLSEVVVADRLLDDEN